MIIEFFDDLNAYLFVELLCTFIIGYICLCTYYTLFSIKFFNIFYIAPNQLTDANSLLFLGIMLCRLTASMSLNVLGMIHMDFHIYNKQKQLHIQKMAEKVANYTRIYGLDKNSNFIPQQNNAMTSMVNSTVTAASSAFSQSMIESEIHETQFTKLMGHLDILEPLRARFYMYFPLLIILITFSTYKKLGTKCINYIGFFQFLDPADTNNKDNFTNDIISMGKALVQMEKSKISEDPGMINRKPVTTRPRDRDSHRDTDHRDHKSSTSFTDSAVSKLSNFLNSAKNSSAKYTRLDSNESLSLLNSQNSLSNSNHNNTKNDVEKGLSHSNSGITRTSPSSPRNSLISGRKIGSPRNKSPSGNLRLFDDI